MEFYYKFVDRFCDIKTKDSCCQQVKGLAIAQSLKKNYLWKYDAVTLTMLYVNVHDMVSQSSSINFSDAAIMSQKYMY